MPLTIPDQTLAAQVKVPDAMNTLSGIMNFKNQQQALKNSQLAYDINSTAYNKTNQLRDLAANPAMRNPDGSFNAQKFAGEAPAIDPTQGAAAAQGTLQNQGSSTANQASQFALHKNYADTALQTASGLLQDPRINAPADKYDPEQAAKAISEGVQQMLAKGVPMDQALIASAPFVNAVHTPGAVAQMLQNSLRGQLAPQGQVGAMQPTMVNNGQTQTNVNPLANTPPIQNQLPPTTPTFNPDANAPGYLGPQGIGSVPTAATPSAMQITPQVQAQRDGMRLQILQQELQNATNPSDKAAIQKEILQTQMHMPQQVTKPTFVQSGPTMGAVQSTGGTVDTINKTWEQTQSQAQSAQQNIGLLQNIKLHAAGAATGVAADKQSLVSGIAGLLHINEGELVKTNTDLLAKNSSMLALAGGNTDLARTMAEAANPNSHMTKEAIAQAADQIIAQQKLNLAKAKFLTPFKAMADAGHPEMFNNALNKFNSVADSRVIQFPTMTPAEKIAMKRGMTPAEQAEFRTKLGKAEQLGIVQ